MTLLQSPLRKFHESKGGKFVEFAGWEMPILYEGGGVHAEHEVVRTACGMFDVSHMGRVSVKGRHSRRFLERLCTRRISDMTKGQCRYSFVCNERGGVRDDILVYRLDDDDFMLVVNASNREKLLTHFEEIKGDLVVKIKDKTTDTAMVALQGPRAMEHIGKLSKEVPTLKRFRFVEKSYMIVKFLVSRTGYTGEDGVEVILPAKTVDLALKLLLKDADADSASGLITPCGLGARDTLRLEAAMPLYGHELGEDTSALACGMPFALNLDKDEDERGEAFVGLEALKREEAAGGPARTLAGLFIDGKRTARQHMKITSDGKEVGEVTSGCMSPTLERSIAMAYIDRGLNEPGTKLAIETGRAGQTLDAEVTGLPFYKAPKK